MNYTRWRWAETWEELGLMGDSLSFTDEEIITKQGLGYTKSLAGRCCPMDIAVIYSLLDAGEDMNITAKELLNPYTRLASFFEEGKVADGWHIHKGADGEILKTRSWVYADNLRVLYHNRRTYDYYGDNNHLNYWECERIYKADSETSKLIPYDKENLRSFLGVSDDKVTVRMINKSLNRLITQGKVKKTSHGRGRTFQWKAWGWLDNIRTQILATGAKKRKLGDIVNGWKYTKGHVTQSYGMEMHNHEWVPETPIKYFNVVLTTPQLSKQWTTSGYRYEVKESIHELPYYFLSEYSAEAYVTKLQELDSEPISASPIHRIMDNDFNVKVNGVGYKVVSKIVPLVIDGKVDVEDIQSPTEILSDLLTCNDERFDEINKMLRNTIGQLTKIEVTA